MHGEEADALMPANMTGCWIPNNFVSGVERGAGAMVVLQGWGAR